MKVSVIMAACNQGEYLKKTVDSAIVGLQGCKNWEILVIDDHSTDGCCDGVARDGVRVFRPENKLGVSHARHLAGGMVTGDVIVTTDTHVSFSARSLHRMAHWAARLRSIIMPTTDFETDSGSVTRILGGGLTVTSRGLRIDRPRRKRRFPSLFGSVYLMRRDVWDWLGGWLRLPGYWGGEETVMTLAAYRLGVPITLLTNHVCFHHRYRKHNVYPYELPSNHISDIAHYVHAGLFSESYQKIWRPMLSLHYGISPTCDYGNLNEWIDNRAVWTEQRVFKTLFGTAIDEHPQIVSTFKLLERARNAKPQTAT